MGRKELRYRLLQNVLGIIGSVALIYSVFSPDWYQSKGLWHTPDIINKTAAENVQLHHQLSRAVEVERIFGMIASMMAVTAVCICLLLIFCWDPDNYSESKMNPGRVLHPGELLLVVLVPTALLFLISWSLFTNRHKKQIKNISQLGSGYWMGMCSWFTLNGLRYDLTQNGFSL
ncbi:uncharacterized protein si:ch211-256a21.4 isoform X3 [Heptranchias perlo]|uniref:uncharacterized protein si:ch211-256a21.4 isoform X3 n=1 Tax=Heptranchias perlo TaxID=212740 RepID=UPI00355A5BB0